MGLILPTRLTRQPQQPVRIDSAHPSKIGLFAAYNFAVSTRNLVDNKPLVLGTAVAKAAGPRGVGVGGSGFNAGLTFPDYSALVSATGEATILVVLQSGTTTDQGLWMIGSQSGVQASHYPFSGSVYLSDFMGVADSRWASAVSPVVPFNEPHVFTVQFKNGQQRAAQNAKTLATNTLAQGAQFPNGSRLNLSSATGSAFTYSGQSVAVFIWNRYVPDTELAAVIANPWQLFKNPQRSLLVDVPAAGPVNATGTLASTLGNATLAASGAVLNAGAFASTLANATMAASGAVGSAPSGVFASALSDATMSATGASTNAGSFVTSLAGASMSAAGIVINRGAFAATMGDATMSASGTVAPNATGTFSSTLDGATMTAYGYNGVPPVLAGFFHRLPKNPRHVQRIP